MNAIFQDISDDVSFNVEVTLFTFHIAVTARSAGCSAWPDNVVNNRTAFTICTTLVFAVGECVSMRSGFHRNRHTSAEVGCRQAEIGAQEREHLAQVGAEASVERTTGVLEARDALGDIEGLRAGSADVTARAAEAAR